MDTEQRLEFNATLRSGLRQGLVLILVNKNGVKKRGKSFEGYVDLASRADNASQSRCTKGCSTSCQPGGFSGFSCRNPDSRRI